MKANLYCGILCVITAICVVANLPFIDISPNLVSALFCSACFGWASCLWYVHSKLN